MGLLVLVLLYFLPAIIGHNKRDALGIFLLNFFLGWTIIGWVAALFWACTSRTCAPVFMVAGPVRYCQQCGTPTMPAARFCSSCGRVI
ncbi:MAG TPA: superinfection immunity protein [Candidatus Angelobacter sp.]|nr:superinfection immunity protein [Candidatus Angelobacter sp.]